MNGRIAALGASLALSLGCALGGCASGPPLGATAPAFSALDAEGNAVGLAAYEGQVLILDFWAVW